MRITTTTRAVTATIVTIAIVVSIVTGVAAASTVVVAEGGGSGSPTVTPLATFGSGLASGSTIGPDGALYVTDPNAGSLLRVDRATGAVTTVADGLPTQVLGVGGAMDVSFVGRTAYVLVTLVGGDVIGGPHIGDETVGIYRLGRDGHFTVFADIGAWSVDHPPATDHVITTGVQYALERFGGGFLVTDGHHNRVLRIGPAGTVGELIAFDNIVPTGMDTLGPIVLMAQAGPLPHHPHDGKVVAFGPRPRASFEIARGAALLVDVERGRGLGLYAVAQGHWDGVADGSPALPDTGRLVRADRHGELVPVVDGDGNDLVLDRPTSLEIVGDTAYVVGLAGTVVEIDNLPGRGR